MPIINLKQLAMTRKTITMASLLALIAVGGIEMVNYLFGPLIMFYCGSAALILTFLGLAVFHIRRVNKDIKDREDYWKTSSKRRSV